MKHAVLFDLMGTLLVAKDVSHDRRPLRGVYTVLVDHGLSVTEEVFTDVWKMDEAIPSQHGYTPFEECISRFAKRLKWNLDWATIHQIADDICARAVSQLSVDDQVPELFNRLWGTAKLALVTNWDHPPAIYRLLKITNLDKAFSEVTISGEIGIWKPDPGILLYTLERMSINPSDSIYVGDSAVDVEAAISAEVAPVLIVRNDNGIDPFRNPEESLESRLRHLIDTGKVRIIRTLGEVAGCL